MMKRFLLFIIAVWGISPALISAQVFRSQEVTVAVLDIPENYEARLLYRDIIRGSTRGIDLLDRKVIYQTEQEQSVMFRYTEKEDAAILLFINGTDGTFPLYRRGNVSIRKDRVNGAFNYMTMLIRDEEDSYIRIRPFGERCLMDLTLLGYELYKQITLPIAFERALYLSFEEIREYTEGIVDWTPILYSRYRGEDKKTEQVTQRMRALLPGLKHVEDGGYDEEGRLVFIDDGMPQTAGGGLNCSGFSKWVVDGFYFSQEKRFMKIDPLKKRHTEYRGNRLSNRYETERDPFFGLDWTRNLAACLYEAEFQRKVTDPEAFDVREEGYFQYVEDVGYPVTSLKSLLFFLARDYPGSFYLGSVNGQFGKEPVIRQHFHIALFFPYFTEEGGFKIVVMESSSETGIDALVSRYQKNEYVHLVRVDTFLDFGL